MTTFSQFCRSILFLRPKEQLYSYQHLVEKGFFTHIKSFFRDRRVKHLLSNISQIVIYFEMSTTNSLFAFLNHI